MILDSCLSTGNKQQSVFLLDVRQPDQFKQWNIEGSINIPLGKLSLQESLSLIPKDKKIVTICPRGNMSTIAKLVLERYGYNAASLEGGLKAWSCSFEHASEEYNANSKNTKIRLIQFRRIGKGCISYLIDSYGQSIVIDPVYPLDDYVQKATEIGTKISKVFDTHQHADHVSAAKELSKLTGARYYQSSYESYIDEQGKYQQLKDGDVFDIGNASIRIIHTPGHTAGSLSILIESNSNHNNKKLLLTGDTLFVNGIGRPDLRDQVKEFSSLLYDTLHNKLLSLPKDVIVFPAHFDKDAPSYHVISSTLEEIEKKGSELLKLDKQSFIEKVSSLVTPAPSNFKEIIEINSGKKPVPKLDKSFDLEMGPNRCSISI
jgi:glyoxylase-like metal-dependent hydrolase (beta-lactamase superfamily II)/rhodanese-related sulfurtransferase